MRLQESLTLQVWPIAQSDIFRSHFRPGADEVAVAELPEKDLTMEADCHMGRRETSIDGAKEAMQVRDKTCLQRGSSWMRSGGSDPVMLFSTELDARLVAAR